MEVAKKSFVALGPALSSTNTTTGATAIILTLFGNKNWLWLIMIMPGLEH